MDANELAMTLLASVLVGCHLMITARTWTIRAIFAAWS